MSDLTQECKELLAAIIREKKDLKDNYTIPKAMLDEIDGIEASVQRTMAEISQPSRLGLVGQVSSGKTRMLETLLGSVGGILSDSVGAGATTGNIVQYTVMRGDMQTTTFDSWRVLLMDQDRIDALFDEYFRKIENNTKRDDSQQRSFLAQLNVIREEKVDKSPVDFWREIDQWAINVYNNDRYKTLNTIVFEMHRVAGVVAAAYDWLGRDMAVSKEQAFSVMTLPSDHSEPQSIEKQIYANIPDPQIPIDGIRPETFSVFFPIIHKISVNARVPAKVFKIYEKYGDTLQIIDCPGYGASGSAVRDQSLCFVELDDIDSILVLLDSKNPGHKTDFFDDAQRKWGQPAKMKTVVVLNKFDLLQVSQDANVVAAFNELRKKDKIDEQELLRVLATPLQQPYSYALEHVADKSPENLVFFSYAAFVGKKYHSTEPVLFAGREWLGAHCPKESYEGLSACNLWQSVSSRMSKESSLGGLLRDFAFDGGGERLVRTFGDHLNHFGKQNQSLRLQGDLKRQQEKWEKLCERLEEEKKVVPISSQEENATGEYKLSNRQMAEILKKFKSLMGDIYGDSSEMVKAFLSVISEAKEYHRSILVDEIAQWPVWESLFRTIDEKTDYCVPVLAANRNYIDEEMRIPDSTDAFKPQYIETLQARLDDILTDTLSKSIEYAFEKYAELPQMNWGDDQFRKLKYALKKASEDMPEKFQQFPDSLREKWIQNPSIVTMNALFTLEDMIKESLRSDYNLPSNVKVGTSTSSGYDNYYPLQHGEKPRFFPWSARVHEKVGSDNPPAPNHRHLAVIIQIRQAFFEGAVFFSDCIFEEIKYRFLNTLAAQCNAIQDTAGSLERQYDKLQASEQKSRKKGFTPGKR